MTAARPALLLATLLVVAPVALASPFWPGPHWGVIQEGDVHRHLYMIFPFNSTCRDAPTQHVLTLVYAPPTDTLTLTVRDQTAVGQNGVAIVTIPGGPCTWYQIEVAGTAVASTAAYDVLQAFPPDA